MSTLKVEKREHFISTDFGFLCKLLFSKEKLMFFRKTNLASRKIEEAGVASVHTKLAQKPKFFFAKWVKFAFSKNIVLESLYTN